jgi:spore coat polysaccharide biosynthesis protein SpsF
VKIVAIVQARRGSTRLPDKVLADIEGRPLLAWVLRRAARIPGVAQVLLATTTVAADAALITVAGEEGFGAFAGSENDVLDRFMGAADVCGAEAVVRLTADCPLLDPEVSGRVVARFTVGDVDYACNTQPPTFPDGLDTEVFSRAALETAWQQATLQSQREHVTPFIWGQPERFRLATVTREPSLAEVRLTVDDPADLDVIRSLYQRLHPAERESAGLARVLEILQADPGLAGANRATARNEGYERSLLADKKVSS